MNDQRTSYGAMDKHSLVQRICIRQQSPILSEKTGPLYLALVGLMAGRRSRQAVRQNTAGYWNLENPLQRVINLVVAWVLKYNFIRRYSTFAAAYSNKTTWVCIAVISSNILVAKVTGSYFSCFIWPQRQGSIGKQGIYRAEQGIYEK